MSPGTEIVHENPPTLPSEELQKKQENQLLDIDVRLGRENVAIRF
jgi:hypothetical protein